MLVSLVIPVYNGATFINECLESVRACPSDEIECIVVNDGSTDRTVEICMRFIHADARFCLINKENTGVSDSRNRGISEATGNYVFFLDADDYIEVSKWPEILSDAASGAYDMVSYGYYDLYDSGDTKKEQFPEDCDIRTALLSTTLLNTCWGSLLRRDVIENSHLRFREDLKTCEDAIFMLDFAQNAKNIKLSGSCVLYYRIHPGSVMQSTGMDSKLSDLASLFLRRKEYLLNNFDEAAHKSMYRSLFSVITDLFRAYTENRRVLEISRKYKESMSEPAIATVLKETKRDYLSPYYKKLEYMLMQRRFFLFLALYFKIKLFLYSRV